MINTNTDVFKAHEGPVTRLIWYEDDSTLMSGGKDKIIKAWKMPKSWRDPVEEPKSKAQRV
jgi:WD40 repeat protein